MTRSIFWKALPAMIVFCLAARAGAQALLIDFNSTTQDGGPHPQAGYQSYDAGHEIGTDFVPRNYSAFGTTLTLTPSWPDTTDDAVKQMIDRTTSGPPVGSFDANYVGTMLDLVTDWIGADARPANGGNGMSGPTTLELSLSGLPAGDYYYRPYHHDTEHMNGDFSISLTDATGTTPIGSFEVTGSSSAGTNPNPINPGPGLGPDVLSSTVVFPFSANGTDDVIFRYQVTEGANVHESFIVVNGIEVSDEPFSTANPILTINRETGAMELSNDTVTSYNILGYSIKSAVGALDQDGWTPITGNYDVNGDRSVDPDDSWIILTGAGVYTDLSEAELGGTGPQDGGTLASGSTVDLGAAAWIQSNTEDVDMSLLLRDGSRQPVIVEYTGNDGVPFPRSDLNFDGAVTESDWPLFVAGLETDLTGIPSSALAYQLGDLDGDGESSFGDFLLFKNDYDTANGAGAFDDMLANLPEPCSMGLILMGGLAMISLRRRLAAVNVSLLLTTLTVALLACSAAQAQLVGYWNFDDNVLDQTGNGNNGTIMGGVTYQTDVPAVLGTGKSANFNGLAGTYVNVTQNAMLPITTQSEFSISMWVKGDGTLNSDDRVFSEGMTTNEDPLFNLGTQNTGADARLDFYFRNGGGPDHQYSVGDVFDNTWHHITWVDSNHFGTLYVDGVFDRTFEYASVFNDGFAPDTTTFGGILRATDCCNFLGNIDDVAIYPFALSPGNAASLAGGKSPLEITEPSRLGLEVNTVTGNVKLINDFDEDFSTNYYRITSPGNSLDTSTWNSLDDQDYDAIGDGVGESWDEVGSARSSLLGEAFLLGSSTFDVAESISIGRAYNPSVGAQDLVFEYLDLAAGGVLEGTVTYVSDPGVTGDFNSDGFWDCADINALVAEIVAGTNNLTFDMNGDGSVTPADITDDNVGWLAVGGANNPDDTAGGNPFLVGDATLDGSVDVSDFNAWNGAKFTNTAEWCRGDFNASGEVDVSDFNLWNGNKFQSSGALAAVPEPTTSLLAVLGVSWLLGLARRNSGVRFMYQRNLAGGLANGIALLLVVGCTSMALAGRTADRLYRFGEFTDPFFDEGAQIGITVGSGATNPVPGYTFDSIGDGFVGNLQDLFVQFPSNPQYVAPGSGGPTGSTIAAEFDGDGDYLRGDRLGNPSTSIAAGPEDYSGIVNRGFQLWVKPSTSGNGLLQSVVMDTNQHGLQITESGTWSMRYNGTDYDSGLAVSFGDWHYVMVVRPEGPANGSRMYVDGMYVAGAPGGYNGDDDSLLVLGANTGIIGGTPEPGTSEFFHGVLDEIEMFVLGVSTDTATDYGTFSPLEDNEIIAADLAGAIPGDVNRDGSVDSTDVDDFVAGWLRQKDFNGVVAGDLETRNWGDLDLDGVVELEDAFILHEALLAAGAAGLDFNLLFGLPEPSSLVLLGMASLSLLLRRRP